MYDYSCPMQLLVPRYVYICVPVRGLCLFTNLFSFHSRSPTSSSRYGSSCNVSQGSSLLSELDQYHEQDDDGRERDSIHSSHSYGSLSKDGQAGFLLSFISLLLGDFHSRLVCLCILCSLMISFYFIIVETSLGFLL